MRWFSCFVIVICSFQASHCEISTAELFNDIYSIARKVPIKPVVSTVVKEANVGFLLANLATGFIPIPIVGDVVSSVVNAVAKPVKIIIHSWLEGPDEPWIIDLTKAYLSKGDYQIIVIDWRISAKVPLAEAFQNIKAIAGIVARQLIRLNLDLSNTHIIGFSLGAHLGGFIGKRLQGLGIGNVARITGLDPLGPLFQGLSAAEILFKTDADFVDVLHTDGGVFGLLNFNATVDFYANSGNGPQPGCGLTFITTISSLTIDIVKRVQCSHLRATELFIESILSKKFLAFSCPSYINFFFNLCQSTQIVIFGEDTSATVAGTFYFNTNRAPPFALG